MLLGSFLIYPSVPVCPLSFNPVIQGVMKRKKVIPGRRRKHAFLFPCYTPEDSNIFHRLRNFPPDKVLRIPPWDKDSFSHLLLTACRKLSLTIPFLKKQTHLNDMNTNQFSLLYLCQSHFLDECLEEYRSLPSRVPCLLSCLCSLLCCKLSDAVRQTSEKATFPSYNSWMSDLPLNLGGEIRCFIYHSDGNNTNPKLFEGVGRECK